MLQKWMELRTPRHALLACPSRRLSKLDNRPSSPHRLPLQATRLREEGIMIKALDSHWTPNDRSHRWLKWAARALLCARLPGAVPPRASRLTAQPLPLFHVFSALSSACCGCLGVRTGPNPT